MIVRNENNVLALPGAIRAFEAEWGGDSERRGGHEGEDDFLKHLSESGEFEWDWKGEIVRTERKDQE